MRPVFIAVLACGVVTAGALAGDGNREQVHRTAADDANAKAAVLTRADLGTGVTWTGGVKKPDLSPPPSCPGFNPKQSDLVLTGVAETDFAHSSLDFDSEAQVLQTADMVKLDWQRSANTPQLLPCLRATLKKSIGDKFVSAVTLPFPRVSTYTAAYRVAFDSPVNGAKVRFYLDAVLYGKSRTELNLGVTYPAAAVKAVFPAEVRVAKLLVARIKA